MGNFSLANLIELPLFQGIGSGELTNFSSSVPYIIVKYSDGEIVVKDEMPCDRLIVVYHGVVQAKTTSANHKFTTVEKLQAPVALQPEALYGINTRFTCTFISESEVQALEIPKAGVAKLFSHFEVFRLNLINLLSTMVYRQRHWLWRSRAGSTERRLIEFFLSHCIKPSGEKMIGITMEELGEQINETRYNVSCALRKLESESLLVLKRGKILIPHAEKLIQSVQ